MFWLANVGRWVFNGDGAGATDEDGAVVRLRFWKEIGEAMSD